MILAIIGLLAGFFILIIFEGLYVLLELLVQAIEKNQIIIFGNILKSLSLLSVIPLIHTFGVWSLIIANITGCIAASTVVVIYLLKNQYTVKLDFSLVILNILYGVISGLLGWLVYAETDSFISALLIIIAAYVVLVYVKPPFYDEEKQQAIKFLKKSIGKKSNAST